MAWIEATTTSPNSYQYLAQGLDTQAIDYIRGVKGQLFADVLPERQHIWQQLLKGRAIQTREGAEPPPYEIALCGAKTINPRAHGSNCKECTRVRNQRKAALKNGKHGPVEKIFQLPGLIEFDLAGFKGVLVNRRDEALALAEEYDLALRYLEGLESANLRLQQAQAELQEAQQGLRYFLGQAGLEENITSANHDET